MNRPGFGPPGVPGQFSLLLPARATERPFRERPHRFQARPEERCRERRRALGRLDGA
jgi:hypothetical protein